MHGSLYLLLKTEGELQELVRGWVKKTYLLFLACYFALSVTSLLVLPGLDTAHPMKTALYILPILVLLALTNILIHIRKNKDLPAFIGSAVVIALLMTMFGVWMFPNLIISIPNYAHSLNIVNASSSQATLKTMLIIACIGMPLVIGYTTVIYRIFRGKVKLDKNSY